VLTSVNRSAAVLDGHERQARQQNYIIKSYS